MSYFQPAFFRCALCGQTVSVLKKTGAALHCCGQPMERLVPNTVEASAEKHLPVVAQAGNQVTVNVGSAAHPMLEAHSIEWIYLHTAQGGQRRILAAGDAPQAVFCVENDQALEAYAYCNLHGLWKTEV